MQKTRRLHEKLIASILVFVLVLTNFATLGMSLISYAADDNAENITYSAQFVMLEDVEQQEEVQEPKVEKGENEDTELTKQETTKTENQGEEDIESQEETQEKQTETTQIEENIKQEGMAIEITLGVKNEGYLKSAKVDIKDLENQIFKLKDNVSLGEYIQSIDENKIKLKQINQGTEVKIYIPIELKTENSIDITRLQSGVELSLVGTYVDSEGEEEIITKTTNAKLNIKNDVNLIIDSSVEKLIPYVKSGVNEALVQLKVVVGSETKYELPVKDTTISVEIPQINGASIENVNVSSISTSYTNGLSDNDVIFTAENWNYDSGKVTISVNNAEKDGKYQIGSGKDEYIISYTYKNCPDLSNMIANTEISAISNIFNSEGIEEKSSTIKKEYNLSQTNSNIITYQVTRKTQEMSKGYLYANANSNEPEYEVEFENAINVNISRIDLINTIEIKETDEYFIDDMGNKYSLSTQNGSNSYYKSVKLNRENLLSIIGQTGNLELLLEDGTSLIQVTKDTPEDGDGFITISFGENKIDKILIKINNPAGEGILSIGTTKAITNTTYTKQDLAIFRKINNEYIAVAQLQDGIISEMGTSVVSTELLDTITNATVSLSRNELSTLVKNEDVEINIALNNAVETSDMYKNPVFELTFPDEVQNVEIKDINLLYGNDELEIANIETLRTENNNVLIRVTLNGAQTKYILGDQEKGTTIILKTDITVDMYRASRNTSLEVNYYNEDATNYGLSSEWKMNTAPSSYCLSTKQGTYDSFLKIVAPEGFVNAQMISNYKENESVISVNQGRKEGTIDTFADAKTAEMKMILINNTDEEMEDVHILGRTIFSGNKAIIDGEDLGTNQEAPMISEIAIDNSHKTTVYYSENGEATDDLDNKQNGWTTTPEDIRKVKSYLIDIEGTVTTGSMLMYSYNFEIPANLNNNLDLAGTFGTYYIGTKTTGIGEPDKVVLTTGDAPVLKVETISSTDGENAVEGQTIKYTVKVTNEGRKTAEDIVVNSIIPAGTTYTENGEQYPDVTELKIDIDNIEPGKTEEATYEVTVNKTVEKQTYIETNNNVEAKGLEKPIYTNVQAVPVQEAQVKIKLQTDNSKNTHIQPGDEINFTTHVVNMTGENLHNNKIVQEIPEGLEFVDAYVEGFEEDGITSYRENEATYDENTRTVTWETDDIRVSKTFKLTVKGTKIGDIEKELITSSKITSDELDKEYTSNEVIHKLVRPQIEVNYASLNNNKYIKEGDTIKYVLNLSNVGTAEARKINIKNSVPTELRVTSVECTKDGSVYPGLAGENIDMNVNLNPGEKAQVVMSCTTENLLNVEEERITGNNWVVSGENIDTISTNKIENIVRQNPETTNNTYEDISIVNDENQEIQTNQVLVNEKTMQNKEQNVNTYRIIGRAFNDFNKNGQRDSDEEGMANIVVKLCNAETQEVVTQAVTNSIGEYLIENVIPGEYYIKFEYDSTKYQLTDYKKQGVNNDKNSDAIISNYKAVTDKIKITDNSISDIDIGLISAGIFDLSLDANINKVTVQDDTETKVYEMEYTKLAKVDINPKRIASSKVFIEYTINVSNKGEIAGYAKRIVDYLPDDLVLDTTLNSNWYVGADGNAYTQELENVLINPGETKTITLVLTKQMTEENTGISNNIFEIAQSYNEYAIADIDSTEANGAQGEDDMSRADIIIGVQTGGSLINIMIISTTLITLLITLYVIKLHIDKKNKEVIV